MNILGIDEAGRGPVIGPLVVAGVIIPDEKLKILERMGVRDSKRLTENRRTILSRKLKNMFDYEIVEISAKDIDDLRSKEINLNKIERMAIVKIIDKIAIEHDFDLAIIDSLDIKPERLKYQLEFEVSDDIEIIAEHKADDNYLQVAAASIIAKNRRDEEIKKLKKEYRKIGDIGSGYPSDPKTKEFLTNFSFDEMPEIVRRSWKTVTKMK
ncbi:MAG: ribonuclease HII [Methanobrevibacter sp.]|jgi:ribonuclease HII|nr:ribonuclease HII [Candidatus Methanoflexus mossambicus]